MTKFRFADVFKQQYGFSTHLRGAFARPTPRLNEPIRFPDTHELSPHSTHMAVVGIKGKTHKAVNEELLQKWEKEMGKRNDYFWDFGMSIVTFTDVALKDIDLCFAQISEHLSARPDEPVSLDYQLAEIISL